MAEQERQVFRWTRRGVVSCALAALTVPSPCLASGEPKGDVRDEAVLPGVVIPPLIADRVKAMARLYSGRTGRQLVITGGLIRPEVLARQIVLARHHGDDLQNQFGRRPRELREILHVIRRAGSGLDNQIQIAALTIAAQLERGDSVSPHLSGRAVDVRVIDLSERQAEVAMEAAAVAGLRAEIQRLPPHMHVEIADGAD